MTDLGFGSVTGQAAQEFLRIEAVDHPGAAGDYGAITIGGQVVPAIGLDQLRGTGYLTLLAGRAPVAPGEVALGAQTMRALHLRLGQTVTATADHESTTTPDRPAAMRVVGEVVFPQFGRGSFAPTGLGTGAIVPASVLSETDPYGGCDGPGLLQLLPAPLPAGHRRDRAGGRADRRARRPGARSLVHHQR